MPADSIRLQITVLVLADMSLKSDEIRFSFSGLSENRFPGPTRKASAKIENSTSIV